MAGPRPGMPAIPWTTTLKLPDSIPQVVVSPRGALRLRSGHAWVYRSDLEHTGDAGPGSLVEVVDKRGKALATALYSSSSQIALRRFGRDRIALAELPAMVRRRILDAIAYRTTVVRETDAYRIVFSEADLLPGLIVDRYNDLLVVQVLTQAMDEQALRQVVAETLAEEMKPARIIEHVDPRIRELEQLPWREDQLLYSATAGAMHAPADGAGSAAISTTIFTMNGIRFHYNATGGQKTGAFLDQRENYAAAEYYAHGRALDVFTYQGGFALHLGRACEQVTAVDASLPALEAAERNAALNGGREIEWIEGNAFDIMRDYADAGAQYDTIVLDPPAFAKSKRALATALRGYKELNLRALKMLRRGGVLVTCSCSFHVAAAEFLAMLSEAAADAHRDLRILEIRGQSKDHPVLLGVPETCYLKCVICQVL